MANILEAMFNPKKILCPYDMAENRYWKELIQCASCKKTLPPLYRQDHLEAPPFFLQVLGESQMGKSVFLQSTTLNLYNMNRFWPLNDKGGSSPYTSIPLTEETRVYRGDVLKFQQDGKLPEATQLTLQQAYIMELKNMRRWGSRTLVMRDIAGNAMETIEFKTEYLPYFLYVPVTVMMFSPTDLIAKPEQPMDNLMTGFITTLASNKRDYKKDYRRVVVTISKADKLGNLPNELNEYLESDPFRLNAPSIVADHLYMSNYMNKLEHISEVVKNYISEKVPGGNQFLAQAELYNVKLVFCIISSTGSNPRMENNKITSVDPKRVLDPLFWGLDLQSKP